MALEQPLSRAVTTTLEKLAPLLLCTERHQKQKENQASDWAAKVHDAAAEIEKEQEILRLQRSLADFNRYPGRLPQEGQGISYNQLIQEFGQANATLASQVANLQLELQDSRKKTQDQSAAATMLELQRDLNGKLLEIRGQLGNFQTSSEAHHFASNINSDTLGSLIADFQLELQEARKEVQYLPATDTMTKLQRDLDTKLEGIRSQLDEFQNSSTENQSSSHAALTSQVAKLQLELQEAQNESPHQSAAATMSEFQRDLNTKIEEIRGQLDEFQNSLEANHSYSNETLTLQVTNLQQELQESWKEVQHQSAVTISELQRNLNTELQRNLNTELHGIRSQLGDFQTSSRKHHSSSNTRSETLVSHVAELKSELQEARKEAQHQSAVTMPDFQRDLDTKFKEIRGQLSGFQTSFDQHYSSNSSQISELNSALQEAKMRNSDLQSRLQSAENRITAYDVSSMEK